MSSTSNNNNNPITNGTSIENKTDAINRLSSFKLPRDLSLGGNKPTKKVFTPNLNVVRNKNKAPTPVLRDGKNEKNHKNRHDRNNSNRGGRGGSNIVKASGVFSEGIAASERVSSSRLSYGGRGDGGEAAAVLTKPTLRLKKNCKVDKDLEEMQIRDLMGESDNMTEDEAQLDMSYAPIKLPIGEGGDMYTTVAKRFPATIAPVIKQEGVVVKQEPGEHTIIPTASLLQEDVKPDIKLESFDSTDIVGLLRSEQPKLVLLQLPDNLPGRGPESDVQPSKSNQEDTKKTVENNNCKLSDLEEGQIGKIVVYKSGKVKMLLGDTYFDLCVGTKSCFRQDVMSVSVDTESRTGSMINLGGIDRKLTAIPDWEKIFNEIKT